MAERDFDRLFKSLSGLLYCKYNQSSAAVSAQVYAASAGDGRQLGVYVVSLLPEEKLFLQHFLQALGWQLRDSSEATASMLSRWQSLLVFGSTKSMSLHGQKCLPAQEGEGALIQQGVWQSRVPVFFLPALGDIMQDARVKKVLWVEFQAKNFA